MSEAHHGPLHQFEVHSLISEPLMLGGVDISFTNASLFMLLSVVASSFFLIGGMRKKLLVPGRWQSMAELTYEFVANMLRESVGTEGRQYFPLIFTLFIFIIMCNLLGLVPYSFTVTSHIIVTFAFALCLFIAVTLIGFVRHGFHYLELFLPKGVPLWLAPIMVVIELMSYLMRPITLSLRLAGNMMAGHILLKVVAGFVVGLIGADAVGYQLMSILPFGLLIVFTGFELLVAVLQAYIFSLLVCVYLNDAVHMH